MKRLIILLAIFLFIADFTSAQIKKSTQWKRYRYELIYGIGASNFLGELGGANDIGTNYYKDLEISMTQPALSIGMRYRIQENKSVQVALTYGILKGDDKLTNETFRNYRNLHFRSTIIELSSQFEYSLLSERLGHKYDLRKVKGLLGFKLNSYFFVGVAGFYFNPKAKWEKEDGGDGNWHALQPLGTEGQGLVPTREKYSRIQVSIPFGIGLKYEIHRKWFAGLQFGMRKTFTDYIDDVSTSYYDYDLIEEARGDEAAHFSDPSHGGLYPNRTAANQQRGDAYDKDSYMFLHVTFIRKIRTSKKGLPKF